VRQGFDQGPLRYPIGLSNLLHCDERSIAYEYEGVVSEVEKDLEAITGGGAENNTPLPQYEDVVSEVKKDLEAITVGGKVVVMHQSAEHVVMEWESDPMSDMIADSIVAVVLQLEENPGTGLVKVKPEPGTEGKAGEGGAEVNPRVVDVRAINALLRAIFGDVSLEEGEGVGEGKLTVTLDGKVAVVDAKSRQVDCEDEGLGEQVRVALRRIETAMLPIDCGC